VARSRGTKRADSRRVARGVAQPLTAREQFFYEHVHVMRGKDTAEQERNRSEDARALAAAETWAETSGYTFEWSQDPKGFDTLGDVHPDTVSEVLSVVMKDPEGVAVQGLAGIVIPKGWTNRQERNERDTHEAHLALEEMSKRELNPRQGRRNGPRHRRRNTHSQTESTKKYAAAVSRAQRELTSATEALKKHDARASLATLMQAVYWTAVARTERSYAGPHPDVDAQLRVLEEGLPTWDETYVRQMLGAWGRTG
jgi:hypothetical protein